MEINRMQLEVTVAEVATRKRYRILHKWDEKTWGCNICIEDIKKLMAGYESEMGLKRNLIGKASRKKDDTKDHVGELMEGTESEQREIVNEIYNAISELFKSVKCPSCSEVILTRTSCVTVRCFQCGAKSDPRKCSAVVLQDERGLLASQVIPLLIFLNRQKEEVK